MGADRGESDKGACRSQTYDAGVRGHGDISFGIRVLILSRKNGRPCRLVVVCYRSCALTPQDADVFSAFLGLERDGNYAQWLERIRREGHSRATGPRPNSGPFHQAQRRQRFLEYIVNESLAGRGERLKGYSVAQAVFDRAETFDSNIDPIVRNGGRAPARQASRISRGGRPRRSHSHRAAKGHLHAAHRVQAGANA